MTGSSKRLELFRWGRRTAFRAAFLPLLFVEGGLVAGYFLAIDYTAERNFESAKSAATEELTRVAQREARSIHHQLAGVASKAGIYADQTRDALERVRPAPQDEIARYAVAADGRYHTRFDATDRDADRCSALYMRAGPATETQKAKALSLAVVDPFMASVVAREELISQIYFNSYDSLNRICPPFDVLGQYPPSVDTTKYNFYYLADDAHNPARQTVWTDAYVDPAGKGWMASAISPVYRGDFLEGVVGLDVTLESFSNSVLNLDVPWGGYGILIARDGTILAMPEAAEHDFGLTELKGHTYATAILGDTFKPSSYNIFEREDLAPLSAAIHEQGGSTWVDLGGGSLVASAKVDSSGWTLAIIVGDYRLFTSARELLSKLQVVGWWMIGAILAVHLLFLMFIFRRARGLAASITTPLAKMDAVVAAIGDGTFHSESLEHGIVEVQRTFDGLQATGVALGDAGRAMARARQDLELQALHLRILMDTVPVPVFFADATRTVAGTNAAFREITSGGALSELKAYLGHEAHKHLRPDDGRDMGEFIWRCGDGPEAHEFLARVARLPRPVHEDLTQERDAPVFIGVLIDLTAQEQARIHAEQARDAALTASKLKTGFLASVSHEIRTPMNGVIGMTELLEGTALDDEQRLYVKTVRECASALLVLINDILDFSALEAGRTTVTEVDFDPTATTESVLDILWPRALAKGITLTARVEDSVPDWIRGDDGRVRQILLNLVGNAVKFTDSGEVHVRVYVKGDADAGGFVCVDVRDTGPGVPAQLEHLLFQPFSQLDSSDKRRHAGTGLGLSISKRLVELLGGEIGYRAAPEGAIFWFTVPLQPPVEKRRAVRAWGLGTKHRVLIADRSAARAANTASYLRAWGADVHIAHDGAEALAAVRAGSRPFTAAFVDAALPPETVVALREGLATARWAWIGPPSPDARANQPNGVVLSVPIKRDALRDFFADPKMA